MRTKEEILKETQPVCIGGLCSSGMDRHQKLLLEILLDIRDLLAEKECGKVKE